MLKTASIEGLRSHLDPFRRSGELIGFVPTMGYLHEGHLSLVRLARARAARVVVSIFVNPLQFNDADDFEAYPIDLERDSALLAAEGVEALFLPDRATMYQEGHQARVSLSHLTSSLEGEHRPGHFDGVTTVVSMLLNIVQPHVAIFGEKDFQQLRIVEQMVADLKFPTEIVRGPLMREADGLAMSSRNVRLSAGARKSALSISRGLRLASERYCSGEVDPSVLCDLVRDEILGEAGTSIDYVRLCTERTLEDVATVSPGCRLLVAATVGGVRLIDNISLER